MKNAQLIKKLRLKKGCKYIVFFPTDIGIDKHELAGIVCPQIEFMFLLEKTKGIKVIEK